MGADVEGSPAGRHLGIQVEQFCKARSDAVGCAHGRIMCKRGRCCLLAWPRTASLPETDRGKEMTRPMTRHPCQSCNTRLKETVDSHRNLRRCFHTSGSITPEQCSRYARPPDGRAAPAACASRALPRRLWCGLARITCNPAPHDPESQIRSSRDHLSGVLCRTQCSYQRLSRCVRCFVVLMTTMPKYPVVCAAWKHAVLQVLGQCVDEMFAEAAGCHRRGVPGHAGSVRSHAGLPSDALPHICPGHDQTDPSRRRKA